MSELRFSTGVVTYKVNGKGEISFNPSDHVFIEKLLDTFDKLAKKNIQDHSENNQGTYDVFASVGRKERETREMIDALFGGSVCDIVFGSVGALALSNGLPVWCNFLMAVIDEVVKATEDEQGKAHPRVEQYMKKYEKYQRK